MGKAEKLIAKLKTARAGYNWSDLVTLLQALGFTRVEGAGSRVKFINNDLIISLHKPHPQKEVKQYAVKQVRELLEREEYI